MAERLCIVIVNWNVCDLLRDCLRSVYASQPNSTASSDHLLIDDVSVDVKVVDNASYDDSVAMLRTTFPQVDLLVSDTNLGFTAGNNLALRQCDHDYVLLLNPDTVVAPDALAAMLKTMRGHPEVGALGPRLLYGDGTPQSSRRRFPTLAMAMMESTLLEEWFPSNRWRRAYHLCDVPDNVFQEVDWVNGACMLVRGAVLSQVGLLDEGYFMYSEELDWCRRMADRGWRVAYTPEAVVTHLEGRSSSQVVAQRQLYFETSKLRYWHKHHGPAQTLFLRLFLLGTYLLRWLIERIKWLLGHKRKMRRQRLAAYCTLLRSGLPPAGTDRAS